MRTGGDTCFSSYFQNGIRWPANEMDVREKNEFMPKIFRFFSSFFHTLHVRFCIFSYSYEKKINLISNALILPELKLKKF